MIPDNVLKGLRTICGAGDPRVRSGVAIYIYSCNVSMENKYVSLVRKFVRPENCV